MHDSETVLLSFAAPKSSAQENWLSAEIASAAILVIEGLVFATALLGAGSMDGYAGYSSNAFVFLALWICLALECVALALSGSAARYRGKVTFILGIHGLLIAILGLMSLPTLF